MATPSIFISYRRDDSAGHAGRLFDRLAQRFGDDHVFRDVDDIAPGEDFAKAVHEKIQASDVLIAVIGARWLGITDAQGRPRLQNPQDLVRREIASALERDIRVIPVLVHDGRLPAADALPADLRPLVLRNAIELRDTHFDADVAQLFEQLAPSPRAGLLRRLMPLGLVLLLGLAIAAAIDGRWWSSEDPPDASASNVATVRPSDPGALDARLQLAAMEIDFTQEAFIDAAMRNDETAVELFLAGGMPPDFSDGNGVSPLSGVVSHGNLRLADRLIASGADPGQALTAATSPDNTAMFDALMRHEHSAEELGYALIAAGREGSTHAIEVLLEHGADLQEYGGQALLRATHELRVDAVRLLLARGVPADSDALDDGWMPLQAATSAASTAPQFERSLQIVRLLLDRGANVNARRDTPEHPTPTALLCALKAGHAQAARLLIEHGADVESRSATGVAEGETETGRTALMWAAEAGMLDIARLLIDKGAQVDARADGNANALIDATRGGHLPLIELLLARGAAIDARDAYDRTALMIAASVQPNPAAMELLLANDADVDARSRPSGRTALMHLAARPVQPGNHQNAPMLKIARRLIDAGADLDARDAEGLSALDLARRADSPSIVALLANPDGEGTEHARGR